MPESAVASAFIGAGVAGIISFVSWFLFQRPIAAYIKKTDDLESELKDLQDRRVAKIEEGFASCSRQESDKRGALYRRIEDLEIKTTHIDRVIIQLQHLGDRLESFVIDITRAGERLDQTAARVDNVQEKQVALGEELAHLQGKISNGDRR